MAPFVHHSELSFLCLLCCVTPLTDLHLIAGRDCFFFSHYSNHEDVVYTAPRGLAYMSLVLLYAGSQTPLYFMGGSVAFVVADVVSGDSLLLLLIVCAGSKFWNSQGGSAVSSWYVIAYTLSLAAICPFTGKSPLRRRPWYALVKAVSQDTWRT